MSESITDRLAPVLQARATYGLLPYGALSAAAREVGTSRAMAALTAKKLGLAVYTKKENPLRKRPDGRLERVCEHGVGHGGTHGCCYLMCCKGWA